MKWLIRYMRSDGRSGMYLAGSQSQAVRAIEARAGEWVEWEVYECKLTSRSST